MQLVFDEQISAWFSYEYANFPTIISTTAINIPRSLIKPPRSACSRTRAGLGRERYRGKFVLFNSVFFDW
jgi:hypothetical protein